MPVDKGFIPVDKGGVVSSVEEGSSSTLRKGAAEYNIWNVVFCIYACSGLLLGPGF